MPESARAVDIARVQLVAPIYRTDGNSGAFVGLASDGQTYFVKPQDTPQGIRSLAAEVVVHAIGRLLAAPVCQNALVQIPAGLNWQYIPSQGLYLHEGLGHGSLEITHSVVADEWSTYSGRDHNRERQALIMAIWELCMGGDAQWLHAMNDDFSVWSFDHGFWLGGEGDWSAESLRSTGIDTWGWRRDGIDPESASRHALIDAADRVIALSRAEILAAVGLVPVEWAIPREDLDVLADVLYLRTEGVAERLKQAAAGTNYN
ncbi:MAG TPA: hypothetical protein VIJ18_07550 [Microbacteriaceae bacterium]